MICFGLYCFKSCVIILVLMTSNGHEIKPARHAANIPASDALTTLYIPLAISFCLTSSNTGN